MKAFTLLALVAPAFAEELLARGGGGGGGDWGYGDKTTKVTYTTSTYDPSLISLYSWEDGPLEPNPGPPAARGISYPFSGSSLTWILHVLT